MVNRGRKLRSEIRKQLIANQNSLNLLKRHFERTGDTKHLLLISLKEKILLELREQNTFNEFKDIEIENYIEDEVMRRFKKVRTKPPVKEVQTKPPVKEVRTKPPVKEVRSKSSVKEVRTNSLVLRINSVKNFIQRYPAVIFLFALLICLQIMTYIYGNGPTDINTVHRFGAIQSGDTNPEELYRVITYIFVHIGGTYHLLSNIACLIIFGPPIEKIYGSAKFMLIFLLTGVFGGIFILFFSDYAIAAGASGSIFGLLGIFIGLIIKGKNIIDRDSKNYILGAFIYSIIYTFAVPNISIAAHLGGLIGGIILSLIITPQSFKQLAESRFSKSVMQMLFVFAACCLVLFYIPKYFVTDETISAIDKNLDELNFERFTSIFTSSEVDGHDNSSLIVDARHLIDHYSDGYLTLSDEGKEYILQNIEDFGYEADSSKELDKSKAQEINIKELKKDATKHLTTFTSFIGNIIHIEEFEYRDLRVTYAVIGEGNYIDSGTGYNNYTVIMFGIANDIFIDDSVVIYGLPIGNYAYQNTLGGRTNSHMVLGSLIEKVN